MKNILTDVITEKIMELTEEELADKIYNGTFDGIFSCNDCPAKGLCNNMLPGPFGKPNGLTCKNVLIKFMKED